MTPRKGASVFVCCESRFMENNKLMKGRTDSILRNVVLGDAGGLVGGSHFDGGLLQMVRCSGSGIPGSAFLPGPGGRGRPVRAAPFPFLRPPPLWTMLSLSFHRTNGSAAYRLSVDPESPLPHRILPPPYWGTGTVPPAGLAPAFLYLATLLFPREGSAIIKASLVRSIQQNKGESV